MTSFKSLPSPILLIISKTAPLYITVCTVV
jgi:hypothetical protein